jgi:hypothetical protein
MSSWIELKPVSATIARSAEWYDAGIAIAAAAPLETPPDASFAGMVTLVVTVNGFGSSSASVGIDPSGSTIVISMPLI